MTHRLGMLLVLTQPPVLLEEEFNAWYDTEHIPERAGVPGFQTAMRYVAPTGHPRYMAVYDLESIATLESLAYLNVSGNNFSPWTKRVTSRVQIDRIVAEQIFPGDLPTIRSPCILFVRSRATDGITDESFVIAARAAVASHGETSSLRVFKTTSAQPPEYFALVSMATPLIEAVDPLSVARFPGVVRTVTVFTAYDFAS